MLDQRWFDFIKNNQQKAGFAYIIDKILNDSRLEVEFYKFTGKHLSKIL